MAATRIVIIFLLSTLLANVFAATLLRKERNPEGTGKDAENVSEQSIEVECENLAPCGWAVYKPFQRTVMYFMKNSCECPKTKKCVRADDDIAISAYVYRCQE